MNIKTYTIILTYFMAAIGIAATNLVEGVEPRFTAVIVAGAGLSLYFNVTGRQLIPRRLWNLLAALILVFFIADYAFISQSLLVSSARFLAVLFTFKLFDLRTSRDYLMAYLIVFFELLAAAASTVSILFFVILSLFVAGGIWGMIIFNIKADWENANPGKEGVPGAIFGLPFFFFVLASSLAAVVMAFMMFFIMPRMELGFFERKTANTLKVSGFSDKVDLGDIGSVKTDPTVVMRVEIKGAAYPLRGNYPLRAGLPEEFLRLRGTTLEHYDGRSWKRVIKGGANAKKDVLGRFVTGRKSEGIIEHNILLEPLDTDVIFAFSYPVMVEGKFPVLKTDRSGSLFLPSPPYSRLEYTAWSSTGPRMDEDTSDLSAFLDTTELEREPSWNEIRRLERNITKGARDGVARARAIEEYLKNNYGYSLNPSPGKGKTPLEDFLFYAREGYCEHFSTAMAVMLRSAGIPSRLVTGFVQGEWNRLGGYFIVRQENAHSWVEAYVKGRDGAAGWMTFDPTPSAGLGSYTKPSTLSLYLDLIRWKWNRNVVHYSIADQRKLAMGVEGRIYLFVRGLKDAFRTQRIGEKDGFVLPVAVAAIIAAAILFTAIMFARSRDKAGRTPVFYLEMQRILRRRGIARRHDETPLEFAVRVGNPHVSELTEIFQKIRYGTHPPKDGPSARAGIERIKIALEGLKGDMKRNVVRVT